MPDVETLKAIGRYEIQSLLGKGGMGVVYKALDPVLGRHVALKVGAPENFGIQAWSKKRLQQCLNEARSAAQFIHPNIAITYDAGFENNRFYMAIEYIDGKGLDAHARPGSLLSPMRVLEVLYNICYALDYIHQKDYIHLDIKPSNIMLTQAGDVKLMDFGIARFLKDAPKQRKGISGSLFYMSPEQAEGGTDLSVQTDIFSLGVAAYQLLTGKRPFTGETDYQVIYQILHQPAPSLAETLPDISSELDAVIQRALQKNAADRFQTAREFADALLPVIKGAKGMDSKILNQQDKKKIDYLKRLSMFRYFQENELMEILRISSWSFHPAGDLIAAENENDRSIYILILGRASILVGSATKPLGPGECFGESSVVQNMTRNASLKAETDCVVLVMNANVFNQAETSVQVKLLKAFYLKKTLQLVDANLQLIRQKL